MSSRAGKLNPIFLDYEFNESKHKMVNLVSCVTKDPKTKERIKWWLHKDLKAQKRLANYLKKYNLTFGFSCVAECRSYMSLGLEPLDFKWIDMFFEYRMLTNHNDRLQWGKQLVNGEVKFVVKPKNKWERTEEDAQGGFVATHSLAEATYKLTGLIRDTDHKTEMRDLIISAPEEFTPEQREAILNYNAEDVDHLEVMWEKIKEEAEIFIGPDDFSLKEYAEEAMERGRYAAHTAHMESIGYPINYEATKNFSRQIPSILNACRRDINSQFPTNKPFKWNKSVNQFSWKQKSTRVWIEENTDSKRWMKTKPSKRHPEGQLSLSLEAFEKYFSFKHDYPRGNFGGQIVRFLKLKQSLAGFVMKEGETSFWDYVGPDKVVRPYLNPFKAQSSRSQPSAKSFMFLKPAWMRSLVQPPIDTFCAGVDYGQEEFFIAGLESQDKNMIAAYLSGDPYLYGAKLAKVIPKDGTREEYEEDRDIFKNTYLGIQFGMSKYGLAVKLTNDTGRVYTVEEAQEQIELFEEAYPDYMEWKKDQLERYEDGNIIKLPCGWYVGRDNINPRSILNVPIQGRGASTMRKSVDIAVSRGCRIFQTLHDADYIWHKVGREKMIVVLMEAMREAFQFYYRDTKYFETAGKIKLDPFAWSPNYKPDSYIVVDGIKIKTSNIYKDKRALNEYNMFSKYFTKPETDYL